MMENLLQEKGVAHVDNIRSGTLSCHDIIVLLKTLNLRAQYSAFEGLIKSSFSVEDVEEFVELGGINSIISIMKEQFSHISIQFTGCFLLGRLSKFSVKTQNAIVQYDGVATICSAMARFNTHFRLIQVASRTLSMLDSSDKDNGIQLDGNTLLNVASSLVSTTTQEDAIVNGFKVLRTVASFYSPKENDDTIEIVIEKIMNMCTAVLYNADICYQALWTIRILCLSVNGTDKTLMTNQNGLDFIFNALEIHKMNAKIQVECIRIISCFGNNIKNIWILQDYVGLIMIIRAMNNFPSEKEIQEWSNYALLTLSIDSRVVETLLSSSPDIIDAVVKSMENHIDNVKIQAYASTVLLRLATNNHVKVRLVASGALDAIVMAMVIHVEVRQVQQQGYNALMKLQCDTNADTMTACNVEALISRAKSFCQHRTTSL